MGLYNFTYYDGEGKPARNSGNYEYLRSYAVRMVEQYKGVVEVRDAHGTLKASVRNEGDEVKVWENKT